MERTKSTAIFSLMMILAGGFLCLPICSGHAEEPDGGFILYPAKSGAPGPAEFSHRSHDSRGAGFDCNNCHASPSAQPALIDDGVHPGLPCGSCHDGKTRGPRSRGTAVPIQDCRSCHMPADDIGITLNRMDPVAFSHVRHLAVDGEKRSSRSAGFSCSDCHPKPFERDSKIPIGMEVPHESGSGGCAECHSGRERSDGNPTAFAANTRCLTCHKSP